MKIMQEIVVPQDNANDSFITIVELLFANGDKVTAGAPVLIYENSKMTVDLHAEADGYIRYLCAPEDEAPIGKPIVQILSEPAAAATAEHAGASPNAAAQAPVEPRLSRAAAELARLSNLGPDKFSGMDFVTSADVIRVTGAAPTPVAKQPTSAAGPEKPVLEGVAFSTEPLTPEKRTEIRYLSAVQPGSVTSSLFVTVSARALLDYTGKNSAFFKKSLLPLVILEAQKLLPKFSLFNAFFWQNAICRYERVSLGLALDMGAGLRVVRLPEATHLSLREIEVATVKLVQKYFKGQLEMADVTGTTFTITDLSQDGVAFFTPLINRQQSAVLSIGAFDAERGTQIIGVTFDHRVASGRDAAQFLRELKRGLESYETAPPSWTNQKA